MKVVKMNIEFSVLGKEIETPRVILRPFEETDLKDFNEYASVPGVGELAGWPHHKNLEESKEKLSIILDKKDTFAIFHKKDKKVIGSFSLRSSWSSRNKVYEHLKAKEIGYVLAKPYWGQGIVPEIVEYVKDFAKNELGIQALGVAYMGENNQSRRVIEKAGFTYIETGKFYLKHLEKELDDHRYIFIFNTIKMS